MSEVALRWLTAPGQVTPPLRAALAECWRAVSDAGGAVGFPFPPVDPADVARTVEEMAGRLDPRLSRLLVATADGDLAGWLLVTGNAARLTAHWASVSRVQTALAHRGTGVARALVTEAARAARDDLGLTALHLQARGGAGLEDLYAHLGWVEVGRWPGALRLSADDVRDEVLVRLEL
ncbi:GNAT superfamily N-acetyltransferase [Geodermatophilus bullaregiensis]|uniref:GNAT family N-acetyltransferase n=1 Tax=Geodermatophilus bullaregiensis TaxID=1564160 RepID=UPI0019565B30|nr:GNAT family N-acetyltransferase [Geodermatophilus bullaregiensis]MBM7807272.1 GNAT superfamily N-acetyltransferase [Geodermatophilus bullaregiensis]